MTPNHPAPEQDAGDHGRIPTPDLWGDAKEAMRETLGAEHPSVIDAVQRGEAVHAKGSQDDHATGASPMTPPPVTPDGEEG